MRAGEDDLNLAGYHIEIALTRNLTGKLFHIEIGYLKRFISTILNNYENEPTTDNSLYPNNTIDNINVN